MDKSFLTIKSLLIIIITAALCIVMVASKSNPVASQQQTYSIFVGDQELTLLLEDISYQYSQLGVTTNQSSYYQASFPANPEVWLRLSRHKDTLYGLGG